MSILPTIRSVSVVQISAGFIQFNGPPAEFLDRFSPVDQGILMIVLAGIFGVAGWASYGW